MTSKNQVAIVTGANKGIGKAIAIGLARTEFKTVLIARDEKSLEETANEIEEISGSKPLRFQLDITETNRIPYVIQQIVEKYKTIDVLVNNAGIHFDGTLSLSETNFRKLLDTNVVAQFAMLQAVVPVMKKQKSGYIFNVASRSGKVGFADSGGYSASKFGMVGLSESLYRELAPQGIKVTALCPAWVNTKMAFEAGTTLKPEQIIQPEDLMKTILWLLSLSAGACVKEVVIANPKSL